MKKFYTIYFSVLSEKKPELISINSKEELINQVYRKTSHLIDKVKRSPSKEVINNILQYANN